MLTGCANVQPLGPAIHMDPSFFDEEVNYSPKSKLAYVVRYFLVGFMYKIFMIR